MTVFWKSAGGGTWVWVAEPGCAQSGTVGVCMGCDCALSKAIEAAKAHEKAPPRVRARPEMEVFIAKNCSRGGLRRTGL